MDAEVQQSLKQETYARTADTEVVSRRIKDQSSVQSLLMQLTRKSPLMRDLFQNPRISISMHLLPLQASSTKALSSHSADDVPEDKHLGHGGQIQEENQAVGQS